MIQVGSLRRCPVSSCGCRLWLGPIFISIQALSTSSALCLRYVLLKYCTVLAFFSSLGTKFHPSTARFEKKLRRISRRAACVFRFSGSAALLVSLPVVSTFWNQVSLFTLSIPRRILNVCTMSAWCLLSSSVVRPSSFSFSFFSATLFLPCCPLSVPVSCRPQTYEGCRSAGPRSPGR